MDTIRSRKLQLFGHVHGMPGDSYSGNWCWGWQKLSDD